MKKIHKESSIQENVSPPLWHVRVREGALLLTITVSSLLFLSLLTYHCSDPSWSHFTLTHRVHNAAGRVGAWLSDLILYTCGYLSYLLPIGLIYAAWLVYRGQMRFSSFTEVSLLTLRTIGFFLLLFAGSAFLTMHLHLSSQTLPFDAGGIIGCIVSNAILGAFNTMGASLILTAVLLIGFTLMFGISWFRLTEALGLKIVTFSQFLHRWIKKPNWSKKILSEKVSKPVINKPISNVQKSRISKLMCLKKIKNKSSENIESHVKKTTKKLPHYSKSLVMPKLTLLDAPKIQTMDNFSKEVLEVRSFEMETHLADFGVEAKVVSVYPGPVVTRFELELAAGTKVSKITALAKDLARSLSVISVRVVEVIPGKSVVGLELPNDHRALVNLQEILGSQQYKNAQSSLTLALGKDISGDPVVVDLAKMPHLLVAGTTGSGKSVCLNAMLLSLLYKSTPKQLRLILIDPKMLELAVYDGIPHLLTPVVTDMRNAATALRWCVLEMERRYRLMASLAVRNIAGYNEKIHVAKKQGKPLLDLLAPSSGSQGISTELQELPYIVVIADEFADMMVVVGKKVETLISRLAQKARAAGVHLLFATQRPSVDVVTGLIKANIPSRIAFQVSSKVDSRTILDQSGAEQLLGTGDMLYLPPGSGLPVRVHGAYVSDDEVHRVVSYLKESGEPEYLDDVISDSVSAFSPGGYTRDTFASTEEVVNDEQDLLYNQAKETQGL